MKNQVYNILNDMSEYLSMTQMKHLQGVLIERLEEVENTSNIMYLTKFIAAKRIEGCSERTIQYYQKSIEKMLSIIELPIRRITTEALREYLITYQSQNNCSNSTLDNMRRNLSSFFSWLEEEDYILKEPCSKNT